MDVLEVLKSRIGNTLVLGGIGFLVIFFGSLFLGVVCAWKEGGWTDRGEIAGFYLGDREARNGRYVELIRHSKYSF